METTTKQNNTSNYYPVLTAVEFATAIENPDIFLLDVRGNDEYKEAHIAGAHNIDVTDSNFLEEAKQTLPADKTIAVYCRTGKRSAMASDILSANGYKVIDLEGGITAWQEAGEPVTNR